MEGVADGRAVDSCFYCALLFPHTSSCPKCRNSMRYLGAEKLSAPVDEIWRALRQSYAANPHSAQAMELLQFAHRHQLAPDAAFLDELREAFND